MTGGLGYRDWGSTILTSALCLVLFYEDNIELL